jgi:hypothetical protein
MLLLPRILISLGQRHLSIVVASSEALISCVLFSVSSRHSPMIGVGVNKITVARRTLRNVEIVVLSCKGTLAERLWRGVHSGCLLVDRVSYLSIAG